MGLLQDLIARCTERSKTKVSKTDPNVANHIANYLRGKFPDLAMVPNLWFSGSNVWKWMYDNNGPDPDCDIDCFFIQAYRKEPDSDGPFRGFSNSLQLVGGGWEDPRYSLLHDLGYKPQDADWNTVKTGANLDKYAQGCKFMHRGRKVDVWQGHDTVAATLNDYPQASHAHCRVAFSFTEGLVVLPNTEAK